MKGKNIKVIFDTNVWISFLIGKRLSFINWRRCLLMCILLLIFNQSIFRWAKLVTLLTLDTCTTKPSPHPIAIGSSAYQHFVCSALTDIILAVCAPRRIARFYSFCLWETFILAREETLVLMLSINLIPTNSYIRLQIFKLRRLA